MNPATRRLLMVVVLVVWLVLMLVPTLAFLLARNGQVQLGDSGGRHWRVFLLQDGDAEGLGLEVARPVAPPLDAPAARCLATSVDYWLWTGEGQDVAYCQCVDAATGESLPQTPVACVP